MSPYEIRIIGDPILRSVATPVSEIDGTVAKICEDMLATMYEAPGVGLAAPQVGIQKRLFVYDIGDGPQVVVNPILTEGDGEWVFDEGCLSIPGLSWEIVRPREVHLTGCDLDGNEISIETDEYEARVFQHELDHLDGVLLIEHLDDDQRKEANRILRQRETLRESPSPTSAGGGIRLP